MKPIEKKVTPRSMQRKGYATSHTLLSNLLIRLGVSAETAAEDACRLEHAISDESFEAIRRYAEKI